MEQHYMEVNEFDYLANSLLWMLHRHLVVEILWHLINTHIVYHRLSLYLKKRIEMQQLGLICLLSP